MPERGTDAACWKPPRNFSYHENPTVKKADPWYKERHLPAIDLRDNLRDDRQMATQVSDATRNDAWELLLDLERQTRYYGRLADRYSLRYRIIRYLLLLGVLAEGAAVYFLAGHPPLLWGVGGLGFLALGFITVFDAVTNYAETSARLRSASGLCDEIKIEGEALWRDIESHRLADAQAETRYRQIVNRWSLAAAGVGLETHDHDNVEAAKQAYEAISSRYAREDSSRSE